MSDLSPHPDIRNDKLHGLLPWELYALAGMAGLFAAQYTAPALAMFCLLLLGVHVKTDGPRWPFCVLRWRFISRGLAYIALSLTFALGWFYAHTAFNHITEAQDVDQEQYAWITEKAQQISGRIVSVSTLPDQRLRMVLEDVLPTDDAHGDANTNRPVRVLWTWERPDLECIDSDIQNVRQNVRQNLPVRPMVGQVIQATLSIKPVDMLSNPNGFDLVRFWASKGIFYRAWSRDKMPQVTIISEPRTDAFWRERLRLRVDERLHMLVNHGFHGIGRDFDVTRTEVPENIYSLRNSATSIIMGMLFGDRFAMDSILLEDFVRTDLLHTLALSGQHLIIAGFFATLCIFIVRHNSESLLFTLTTKKLFYLLALPCAALYLWLGNAPPSLVRAATMLAVWALFACASYRSIMLLDTLLMALVCILIVNPLGIYDLGLQLSSVAVASLSASKVFCHTCMRRIGMSAPKPLHLSGGHPELPPELMPTHRFGRYIAHRMVYAVLLLACTSTLVQVALLPIQLMVFGTASPWFLLNVLWMPIADLFVLPFIFLGLACHIVPNIPTGIPILSLMHIVGDFCFWLAMQACQGITILLECMNKASLLDYPAFWRPHWTTALGYGGLLTCFLTYLGRKRLAVPMRRIAVASFALFVAGFILMAQNAYDSRLRLTVFDVGMGQAVYIRTPDNKKILIDGGGFLSKRFDTGRDIVARALTHNQWPRLDMIFNTHPDYDHLKGLLYMLHAFPVQYFGYNGDDNAKNLGPALHDALNQRGLRPQTVLAGDTIDLGSNLALEFFHPQTAEDDAGNEASLVARLLYTAPNTKPKGLAMLCGDVETQGLRAILRYAKAHNLDLSAEVLVLPHHGAKGSFLPAFYDAVKPRTVIASCAKNHHYNYPNPAIKEDFAKRQIPVFDTGHYGALYVDWEDLAGSGHVHWERHH